MTDVPVFISRSGVATAAQESLFRQWERLLIEHALVPVSLPRESYRPDPWDQLVELIESVSGMLVLGTEQISVRAAVWRRGTLEQQDFEGRLPSPWAHIEAAMALRVGLPVLVVAPPDTAPLGVFDSQNWTGSLFGVSTDTADWTDDVARWQSAVLARSAAEPPPSARR